MHSGVKYQGTQIINTKRHAMVTSGGKQGEGEGSEQGTFDYSSMLTGAFMSIHIVIVIILHNLHTIFCVLNNS